MKVVSSRLQGLDDSKELLIIDVIVLFSGNEQLGEAEERVPFTIGVSLQENSP